MVPTDSAALRVAPERAALLVDFQERIAAVMPGPERAACERNIQILLELARRKQIPVVVSEQYSRGLGPTVAALEAALAPVAPARFEKMEFACTGSAAFRSILSIWLGRTQWLVTGMEAHICVWQTVRGLRSWGAEVHLPADAVIPRAPENRRLGVELARAAGAVVTSTETVVFDALERAGGEDFKALSRLVR